MTTPDNQASVTLREVYGLVQALRTELLAELRGMTTQWESKLEAHDVQHQRDRDANSSRVRWAVTTVLAAAGVLVALWKAFEG